MSKSSATGIFVAEGSSDQPIAALIESLFFERGVSLHLSAPDFSLLSEKVRKDVKSRIGAGIDLAGGDVDVVVVHRDSDNVDPDDRRREVRRAVEGLGLQSAAIPVVPVRMTEAWLLLDEHAIRQVAGNPRGTVALPLPRLHEVEKKADPKALLGQCILTAAGVTGRRRETMKKRFNQHRRQLLERLDPTGPINKLESWQTLVCSIDSIVASWTGR